MQLKRGEIYKFDTGKGIDGSALIVSANFRSNGRIINYILLSDEKRHENMIPIVCGSLMYADCEKVGFAWDDRFGNYVRTAKTEEMEAIDECIAKCLGLEQKVVEVPVEKVVKEEAPQFDMWDEYDKLQKENTSNKAKAEVFEKLYKELLADVMK